MESIEIINNACDYIINSIFFIASKSEYVNIPKDNIKYYIEDKYHNTIIIKDNNEIKGFLIYFLIYDEIDIIFIASYPNNNGYGQKLLSYLFNEAENKNAGCIKLDLHENNIKAENFYLKNGFKKIALRKKYYNNIFDAVIMEKKFYN